MISELKSSSIVQRPRGFIQKMSAIKLIMITKLVGVVVGLRTIQPQIRQVIKSGLPKVFGSKDIGASGSKIRGKLIKKSIVEAK